ncbi:hypothetical protein [Hyalangium gracile]|uniref:hypothetical protein n=1 Tax=Hyalangium gracile TaxID=394092 RepID=UPI001CC945A7|nr:hypothetical protein [Hyalangium gracile]
MKRLLLRLALGVGLLSGCSESQTTQTAAGLSGTYDLTSVGSYVFVTSADRNELRVLDLAASPRDWVRAPNPLEPLSIPVLRRPLYLARDVRYDAEGKLATGPYVYARSAGTEDLSVVAADPAWFKEVMRLDGLGFVTAFAARGPRQEGGNSVLYYATQSETGSRLFRLELPGPELLQGMDSASLRGTEMPLAAALTDEAVTALLVLPSTAAEEHIVVATRKTSPTAARGDRTFRLDVTTGAEIAEYQFGGPVRLLATHPVVSDLRLDLLNPDNPEDETRFCDLDDTLPPRAQPDSRQKSPLLAGTYVFGALDESVCQQADQEACSGILAVDAATGARAVDFSGQPMLPIRVGQALPTGLTLAADADVRIRCGTTVQIQRRPLVGIVPASDGRINIFDGAKLRSFDLNIYTESGGNVLTNGAAGQSNNAVVDITGASKDEALAGRSASLFINLTVKEGATRDDTFRVLYEGGLQGLSGRIFSESTAQCSESGCSFFVDPEAVLTGSGGELPMVRPGDILSLTTGEEACATELSVAATRVDPLPDGRQRGVLTTGPLPADCASPTRFTVRGGAQYPLVVYSDARGYLGRMPLTDSSFPIPGGYYFRPAGQTEDPAFSTVSAYLNVANAGELALTRGDQLIVSSESGLLSYSADVDTSSVTSGLAAYRLPGPVVHTRVGDVDFAYIAYPSADGILQVSLEGLVDNTANIRGLVPFE